MLTLISCAKKEDPQKMIDNIAERYVKLSLKCGQLDPDFVDAYHGPEEWKPSEKEKPRLENLIKEAEDILTGLNEIDTTGFNELWNLRYNYLIKQTIAVKARMEMVGGKKIPFDEQAKLLFDALVPDKSAEYFENVIEELNKTLPGLGDLGERLNKFRSMFIIPEEKLNDVFTAAIDECRRRTKEHIKLPENESFRIEYVTDKPWGGYNWYQGNYNSLIQVNTDSPKYIDGALDLAAHEGYPGHHIYNLLFEKKLLRDFNWVEFSVYNLFSPQSLIAEGSANYGVKVVFTKEEKRKFEKEILFPLAGLDASKADEFYKVMDLMSKLNYAGNEATQKLIDGEITEEEFVDLKVKYQLTTRQRAEQNLSFSKKYQAYVINYNQGQDIVKDYVERKMSGSDDSNSKWKIFEDLLSKPYTASELQ